MTTTDGISIIEAILFASGEPVELSRISTVAEIEEETVALLIEQLNTIYKERNSAIEILRLGQSYQLATREEFSPVIKKILDTRRDTPLSAAAMEALAVVAYNQPVTKNFVEQVRGVDSSGVINTLTERGLLEEAGRLDLPGRPVTFATTEHFLRCFGMEDITQLPTLPSQEQIHFDEMDSPLDEETL